MAAEDCRRLSLDPDLLKHSRACTCCTPNILPMFQNKWSSLSWILYMPPIKTNPSSFTKMYIRLHSKFQDKKKKKKTANWFKWLVKMPKLLSQPQITQADSIIIPPFCSNPTKPSILHLPITYLAEGLGRVHSKANAYVLYKNRCFWANLTEKYQYKGEKYRVTSEVTGTDTNHNIWWACSCSQLLKYEAIYLRTNSYIIVVNFVVKFQESTHSKRWDISISMFCKCLQLC